MILKLLRNAAGYVIVFISWLTMPKAISRSEEEQLKVQEVMQGVSLYQLFACPFCIKTRRALHKLNVAVEIHDINSDPMFRSELASQGGRVQVPCLRIQEDGETTWMYESNDIIQYIEDRISVLA